jgi:hypothetical protein
MPSPIVTVDSPSDQAVVTSSQIYVTGMVNDVVPGTVNLAQATVTVNGVKADVTNRTFMAEGVLLVPGKNVITAVATDRAGNTSHSSVTITLLDANTQQRILMVSGNGQSSPIATTLAQPLVVEVVNAAGQPMPGTPVTFSLVKGDGQLTAFPQQARQITPATPSTLATATSVSPSVTNCRSRRAREAPRAPRTTISRLRLSDRTSSRLATFTVAMSSSSADPPRSASRIGRVSPTMTSVDVIM